MPQQTDKIFRKLNAYLSEHESEIKNEEDYNKHLQIFIKKYNSELKNSAKNFGPETADDYLELAEKATSSKKRVEYAKKVLELDSDNIDAEQIIIEETSKNPLEALEKYKKLVEKGAKILAKDGFFEDYEGEFWLAFETRPYMRVRYEYMRLLVDCGMLRLAATECEEMLKLCRNNNLAVRYDLMHIYVMLEDEKSATKLFKKYQKDGSAHFLLPYSILYYKLGNSKKSIEILGELAATNKDTKKFFRAINSKDVTVMDKLMAEMSPYGERCGSIDEFLGEILNYDYLIKSTFVYVEWANRELKKK